MAKAENEECKNETSGMIDEAASKDKGHKEELKLSFKRPDKVLPCPRCNSPDTKFCYFNNYNVNQPRHFCKSCQRYWTAGGTVRNVPVGAGRRRNKHLGSQCHPLTVSSDVGPATLVESESSSPGPTSSPNEMVLKFGPESPHCDPVPTLLQPSLYHRALPHEIATLRPSENTVVPLGPAPDISWQFVPASYWNCIPVLVAGSGNVSLALSNGFTSPPLFTTRRGLQVLGKHSRDTDTTNEEIADKCISAPKTLRIHDSDEA